MTESIIPRGGGLLNFPGGTSIFSWDILRQETMREYDLFRLYMDCQNSLVALSKIVDESEDTLAALCFKNKWDQRSADYRDYLNSVITGGIVEVIEKGILQAGHRLTALMTDQINKAALACSRASEDGLEDPNVLLDRVASLIDSYTKLTKGSIASKQQKGPGVKFPVEIVFQRAVEQPDVIDVTPTKRKRGRPRKNARSS